LKFCSLQQDGKDDTDWGKRQWILVGGATYSYILCNRLLAMLIMINIMTLLASDASVHFV